MKKLLLTGLVTLGAMMFADVNTAEASCQMAYQQCIRAMGASPTCTTALRQCKSSRTKKPGAAATPTSVAATMQAGMYRQIQCANPNKKIVIKKKKIRAKGKIAFMIQGNCHVVFDRVNIKSRGGIMVLGNAKITIKNSTIKTRSPALSLGGNGDVVVSKSTLHSAESSALELEGNARVRVQKRSKLKSAKGKPAIAITGNGKVEVGPKCKINGEKPAKGVFTR